MNYSALNKYDIEYEIIDAAMSADEIIKKFKERTIMPNTDMLIHTFGVKNLEIGRDLLENSVSYGSYFGFAKTNAIVLINKLVRLQAEPEILDVVFEYMDRRKFLSENDLASLVNGHLRYNPDIIKDSSWIKNNESVTFWKKVVEGVNKKSLNHLHNFKDNTILISVILETENPDLIVIVYPEAKETFLF